MKPILEEITKKEDMDYNEETVTKEKISEEEKKGNVVLKIEE